MGNIHIVDSYKISKLNFGVVLDNRESKARAEGNKDEIEVFDHRSRFSMKMEWTCHNALYGLGIARDRTKDVDLDYPQKWYMKVAYTVGGLLTWLFIN